MFWGKTLALAAQLAVLEALLLVAAVLLYGTEVRLAGVGLLLVTWIAATGGLAAVGTLYGGLAAGAPAEHPGRGARPVRPAHPRGGARPLVTYWSSPSPSSSC